ncbi:hypothetical protein J6590_028963 [Homalodisca vitripennis]|nr:hypothetical protein J6590_028963 [Homalodisca vitripennis]
MSDIILGFSALTLQDTPIHYTRGLRSRQEYSERLYPRLLGSNIARYSYTLYTWSALSTRIFRAYPRLSALTLQDTPIHYTRGLRSRQEYSERHYPRLLGSNIARYTYTLYTWSALSTRTFRANLSSASRLQHCKILLYTIHVVCALDKNIQSDFILGFSALTLQDTPIHYTRGLRSRQEYSERLYPRLLGSNIARYSYTRGLRS